MILFLGWFKYTQPPLKPDLGGGLFGPVNTGMRGSQLNHCVVYYKLGTNSGKFFIEFTFSLHKCLRSSSSTACYRK